MRCKACNKLMDDRESVRKDKRTGDFLDLCYECHSVSTEALWELEEPPVATTKESA